jgi:uncharacterized protein (UPF0276 family)
MSRIWLVANAGDGFLSPLIEGKTVHLDRVKVGPWMGDARLTVTAASYPVLLHLSDGVAWPRTRRWIADQSWRSEWLKTPWVSAHLDLGCELLNRLNLSSAIIPRSLAHRWAVSTIQRWSHYSPVRVLVENMCRSRAIGHPYLVNPAFISQVVREANCHFLLDLAHARISAAMRGQSAQDYIAELPLDRLVEIHVSGPRPAQDDGRLIDAHESLLEADYSLLSWVLDLVRPQAVSLEYWRDGTQLEQQLVRLRQIVDGTE